MSEFAKVFDVVKEVFDTEPDSFKEIEEGLISETFEIEIGEKKYIVQFSDEKHLETCILGYKMFENVIPVPDTVTQDVRSIEGENFVIVEKVLGESAETDINPERVRKAGKTLAKIHNYTELPHEGHIKNPGKTVNSDDLTVEGFEEGSLKRRKLGDMYDDKIPLLKENGFGDVAEAVQEFLKSKESIFPEDFTATVSHRDFSPDNIIYQKDEIYGVIDFDFMISGLDVRDLVKAANSFWMHDPDSWNVREQFYDGYKEERTLPKNFEELEGFFRIETLARLVASTIELGKMTEDEKKFYKDKLRQEIEE